MKKYQYMVWPIATVTGICIICLTTFALIVFTTGLDSAVAAIKDHPTFSLGSSKAEVWAALGRPEEMDEQPEFAIWKYNLVIITFSNEGRVRKIKGDTRIDIHYRPAGLTHTPSTTPAPPSLSTTWFIGDSKDDIRRIEGTPKRITYDNNSIESWWYTTDNELNTTTNDVVYISNDKVSSYSNHSGKLKVR